MKNSSIEYLKLSGQTFYLQGNIKFLGKKLLYNLMSRYW